MIIFEIMFVNVPGIEEYIVFCDVMLCYIFWYKFSKFSEEPSASIFRKKEQTKQNAGMGHSAVPCRLLAWLTVKTSNPTFRYCIYTVEALCSGKYSD
jgi:hypothetical protein